VSDMPLDAASQWLELWRQATVLGQSAAALPWLSDFRQLRNAWLATLTTATDSYLRSPAFLELMQSSLKR
jgi:hypothetical protein